MSNQIKQLVPLITAAVLAQLGGVTPAPVKRGPGRPKGSKNRAKQAKPVPEFIVRRAQNQQPLANALVKLGIELQGNANKTLARLCYEAGWTWNQTHDKPSWDIAVSQVSQATSREHLVSLLYALVH